MKCDEISWVFKFISGCSDLSKIEGDQGYSYEFIDNIYTLN